MYSYSITSQAPIRARAKLFEYNIRKLKVLPLPLTIEQAHANDISDSVAWKQSKLYTFNVLHPSWIGEHPLCQDAALGSSPCSRLNLTTSILAR